MSAKDKAKKLFGRFDRPKWTPAFEKDGNDDARGLIGWMISVFFVTMPIVFFWEWMWPDVIPYTLGEFWIWDSATVWNGVCAPWLIYVWGFALTTFGVFKGHHIFAPIDDAEEDLLIGGMIRSTIAGVCEEIIFRYFVFYGAIIGTLVVDWILGGFIFDGGLAWFIYYWFMGWLTNLSCAFQLDWLIYNPEVPWFIASAAISANIKFRVEHAYQGFVGWYNSWIAGFVLFWVMFNYGLVAAILVHFLYDIVVYFTLYVWAKLHGVD